MGDWEANWGRGALERIVILLFALANLADRAAGAPFLSRRRVLGILNRGETEARAFLIGMACGEVIPAEALEPSGDMADLAVRLRALALMLCLILAQGFALPGAAGARVDWRLRRMSSPAAFRLRAPASPAPDTS